MHFKTPIIWSFLLCLCALDSTAQTSPCSANTPAFTVDLSGQPFGTATFGPVQRDGLCCNAQSPDVCLMVTVTLDTNAVGFRFEISSGAIPPGAMYYQVGCGPLVKVGEAICLDGPGPHVLTFCKPGNNRNEYTISSIPRTVIPDSVHVQVGCSVEIGTLGYFVDSTLEWHDLSSSTGEYLSYLNCTRGCDTVLVSPDYRAPDFIDYEVCGTLMDSVCQDSVGYLCKKIRVYIKSIRDTVYASTCGNQAYTLYNGESADTSGTYISIFPASGGCDSIVYTVLDVLPAYGVQAQLTDCDSALCNGKWYYSSQLVSDTFTTMNGCDSVIITELTVHPSKIVMQEQVACDSALVNGIWYYTSQVVTDRFLTSAGCDSTVVTDLTINRSYVFNRAVTECDSALVNGIWYFTSQTVTDNFISSRGCDSIEITELTIHNSTTTSNNIMACNEAYLYGNWYNRSQIVYDTLTSRFGCDSILATDLTIHYTAETEQFVTNCDRANIHGTWYDRSQTIADTFSTVFGCDSVVTTYLTINKTQITSSTIETCDSAYINGSWYTASQTVLDSFVSVTGCDSVHVSYLSVLYPTTSTVDVTLCEGESHLLPDGREVSLPGEYVFVMPNAQGCDSTVYCRIDMNYTYYEPVPDTSKCLGDAIELHAGNGVQLVEYRWSNGQTGPVVSARELGDLYLEVTAANGCTSRDTVNIADANCPACPLYTPTSFTPFDAGLNNDFHPVSDCNIVEYRFEIYNRWGERLFDTDDPETAWDGTYSGKPAQQDVYMWTVLYRDSRSLKPIAQSGTVTLIW